MADLIVCTPKYLPIEQWPAAAERAIAINPANRPQVELLARIIPNFKPTPEHIAAMTSKYWRSGKVAMTVSFVDLTDSALQDKILSHMNAWAPRANVAFTKVASGGQVRIATKVGDGHWSYIGTDILTIAANQPTMNLDGFAGSMPDSEYHRVVRHETGHTLGFIHEHMRQALVQLIDPTKAYPYFLNTQGWNKTQVDQQVLTPIEESSLTGTTPPDP
ncbi:MAG TPA: M12 family metallopeptidase, partial [Silvibacterium sp.]|nr:M12 family metallopeptidase [Silvibacterium sp.]